MQLLKVDPRALKENLDRARLTKSTPQADALLLATIKAVGIVQPPVITPECHSACNIDPVSRGIGVQN